MSFVNSLRNRSATHIRVHHARQQPQLLHNIVRLARELAQRRGRLDDDPLRHAVLDRGPRPRDGGKRALLDDIVVRARLECIICDVQCAWRKCNARKDGRLGRQRHARSRYRLHASDAVHGARPRKGD